MDRIEELKEMIESFRPDFEKFYQKGVKSAGTRVRKHMNELKRKAQEVRKEIQEMKSVKDEKPAEAPTEQPATS
jgi:uncharacterized coiled-coil DUF342 family protein